MSFGFGVGDFLAVLRLSNEIRKRLVVAPDDFRAVSEEVRSFGIILQDIDDLESEQGLTDYQHKEIKTISQGCFHVLSDLKSALDRYQELDTRAVSVRGKARRVWKRATWDHGEINDYRQRVAANVSAFNLLLGKINT